MRIANRLAAALAVAVIPCLLAPGLAQAQRIRAPGPAETERARAAGEREAVQRHKELQAAAQAGARHGAPRTVYVFGDSLSDTGNGYALYYPFWAAWLKPPYALPRFSNGPIWPDHLAATLGTAIRPSVQGGTDFAVAGATISPENYYSYNPPAAGFAQVDRFLATYGSADPRALYVVWLGHNDIDPPEAFTSWNFEQLSVLVGRLHAAGARDFLIPNLFDLGQTPNVLRLNIPGYAPALSDMAVLFNQKLGGLQARYPEARIRIADVYGLRKLIDRYPAAFGFSNTTDPCYEVFRDQSVCANPDRYWYWDENHPTSRAHRLLAGLFVLEMLRAGELKPADLLPGR